MTTLSLPPLPRPTEALQEFLCSRCRQPILCLRDGSYTPTCRTCLLSDAEAEAVKLRGDVLHLIHGAGVFNVLSQTDRQRLLKEIGSVLTADAAECEAPVWRGIEEIPESLRAEIFDSSSDADEVPERWDGCQ